MKTLDSKLLKKFLHEAGERLSGRWLLVGGTLLPAVGIDLRSTVDIDFLGIGDEEARQQLELMEVAESLGLPVESVNQAAGFFLKKVGFSERDLILLHQGRKAAIFRPSVELFWKLKIGRLSETDVQDCEHYLRFCKSVGDRIDIAKLRAKLQSAHSDHSEKNARAKYLLRLI